MYFYPRFLKINGLKCNHESWITNNQVLCRIIGTEIVILWKYPSCSDPIWTCQWGMISYDDFDIMKLCTSCTLNNWNWNCCPSSMEKWVWRGGCIWFCEMMALILRKYAQGSWTQLAWWRLWQRSMDLPFMDEDPHNGRGSSRWHPRKIQWVYLAKMF